VVRVDPLRSATTMDDDGDDTWLTLLRYEGDAMSWKEQLAKAVAGIREAAESQKAREIVAKAKETATAFADKAKKAVPSSMLPMVAWYSGKYWPMTGSSKERRILVLLSR
jgi:hypothetical protein